MGAWGKVLDSYSFLICKPRLEPRSKKTCKHPSKGFSVSVSLRSNFLTFNRSRISILCFDLQTWHKIIKDSHRSTYPSLIRNSAFVIDPSKIWTLLFMSLALSAVPRIRTNRKSDVWGEVKVAGNGSFWRNRQKNIVNMPMRVMIRSTWGRSDIHPTNYKSIMGKEYFR